MFSLPFNGHTASFFNTPSELALPSSLRISSPIVRCDVGKINQLHLFFSVHYRFPLPRLLGGPEFVSFSMKVPARIGAPIFFPIFSKFMSLKFLPSPQATAPLATRFRIVSPRGS